MNWPQRFNMMLWGQGREDLNKNQEKVLGYKVPLLPHERRYTDDNLQADTQFFRLYFFSSHRSVCEILH